VYGIYNNLQNEVLAIFSFPFPFLGTFLLTANIHYICEAANKITKTNYIVSNWKIIVTICLLICESIVTLNTISSILIGTYNQLFIFEQIVWVLYVILPTVIIGFFLFVSYRFFLISKSIESTHSTTSEHIMRMSNRFIKMSVILSITYVLWMLCITVPRMGNTMNYPSWYISIYFFSFFITGYIALCNVMFIPIEKIITLIQIDQGSVQFNNSKLFSIPYVTENSSSSSSTSSSKELVADINLEVKEQSPSILSTDTNLTSYIYDFPMSKASSLTNPGSYMSDRDPISFCNKL
jgi:hypothetical protein